MDSVGIAIGTYGDEDYWRQFASRAAESAHTHQTHQPEEVIWCHSNSLQSARNAALDQLSTEWVIFLDADDELDPFYVEAMLEGTGDIRQPSTLGVVNGVRDDVAVLIPRSNLYTRNYVVIGAMCRRQDVLNVGGFRDLPCLEDWDLWIRMRLAGATIEPCPQAIYIVNVNPNGRNSDLTQHHFVYNHIREMYAPVAKDLE